MLNCQERNIYSIFLFRIFSKYEQCLVEIGDIHYCLFYLPHSAKWKIILHNFKLMCNEREEIPRRFWKLNERDPKAKFTQSHKLRREIKSIRFDNLMEKAWQKRIFFQKKSLPSDSPGHWIWTHIGGIYSQSNCIPWRLEASNYQIKF